MVAHVNAVRNTTSTIQDRSALKAVKLLLPVWGDGYVRQFLDYSVPTLIAPGNLPALVAQLPCTFDILTSRASEPRIRQHPAFASLEAICPVTFRFIDHLITSRNYSTTITLAYTEAVRAAGPEMLDTCFFFLVSDYIMANGSLANVLTRVQAGSNAVLAGNFQVSTEQALSWLKSQLDANVGPLSLTSRQLLGWALKHLHSATIANMVNNPASHNAHTNRLFWRIDSNTLLGRFYLMHMIAIRPEVLDFQIGASCDYSFVPEMCPSGKVSVITDSDDYLVVEMQPDGHESRFLRPGAMPFKELAETLSDWTTARHRENAKESIVFHADELPATLPKSIANADQFIDNVSRALSPEPQPHRGHKYWLGAIAAFREAKGEKLSTEDSLWLHELHSRHSRWLERAKFKLFGKPPFVYPWHPSWPDYRPVLEKLENFLSDESQSLMTLSNAPSRWTLMLAACGERVRRLETSLFLKTPAASYEPLSRKFDICLLEVNDHEVSQLTGELLIRITPLLKDGGKILLVISSGFPISETISARVASQALAASAWVTEAKWVPIDRFRSKTIQAFDWLTTIVRQNPLVGIPALTIFSPPLVFVTWILNMFAVRGTKLGPQGKASSTILAVLQIDKRDKVDDFARDQGLATESIPATQEAKLLTDSTREPQYNRCLVLKNEIGLVPLGLMTNQVWHDDPRRLTFVLARYKFVAKMLAGRKNVGELGCGDAFGTRIVLQDVGRVTVYDFDPVFIEDVLSRRSERWPFDAFVHDILSGRLPQAHDAIYSLDVLEHIKPSDEDKYIGNLRDSLEGGGVLIIGTPSIESQTYASPPSKIGHINCKSGSELQSLLQQYFHSVFLFSMNDEVVHTGFYPMAHYLFAICTQPK